MRYKFPITKAVIRRVGHRGSFLLFLALLDILYGFGMYVEPGPLAALNLGLGVHAWAAIWVGVGIFLLTGCFILKDKWHFAVAALIKIFWATTLLEAWLFQTFPRGWISGVIWLAFAGVVLVISSWPEAYPYRTKKRKNRNGDG